MGPCVSVCVSAATACDTSSCSADACDFGFDVCQLGCDLSSGELHETVPAPSDLNSCTLSLLASLPSKLAAYLEVTVDGVTYSNLPSTMGCEPPQYGLWWSTDYSVLELCPETCAHWHAAGELDIELALSSARTSGVEGSGD